MTKQLTRDEMKDLLLEKYNVEMWPEEKIIAFRKALLDWYDASGRDHLPWRENNHPYRIWVSEIMLQQTQVVTVIPYFNRFMSLFPTIEALVGAEEEELLKAWEGLGYYSRVRNMQFAAKQIMTDFDGVFPNDPKDMLTLKGIGPYTAGAISSMAFNLPEPAVDGNVMRVFSRLFEIGEDIAKPATRKLFELLVRIVIDPDRPGDFNQAIMDLGTDICAPKTYRPEESPIKEFNAAYQNGTMHLYPFKSKKKKPVPLAMQGVVIQMGDQFLLEKRPGNALLANFWTFPLIEADWGKWEVKKSKRSGQLSFMVAEDLPPENQAGVEKIKEIVKELTDVTPKKVQPAVGSFNHIFSHRRWETVVHFIEVAEDTELTGDNLRWVDQNEFGEYAFAVPQQKMWDAILKHKRNFLNML